MKVKIGKWTKTTNRRKVSIQIDTWDTWNADGTLAMIIYPMLLQLKATKQGVPSEFVNDVGGEDYVQQESFDFYKDSHNASWEIASKKLTKQRIKIIFKRNYIILARNFFIKEKPTEP